MISAFLDEAGTNQECPVVTVAGFYGTESEWALFRDAWRPHAKGFHALRCDDRFPNLCAAIELSKINGMFITLGKRTYKALATEHMKSFMGNPYAICAFMCALSICGEVNSPVSFVLEEGQPNLSFVKRILQAMIDARDSCMTAVDSAKKSDFIELHAADFVSHCASSHDKPPLQRLFDSHRLKHGHIGQKQLERVAPELSAIVRRAKYHRRAPKEKSE